MGFSTCDLGRSPGPSSDTAEPLGPVDYSLHDIAQKRVHRQTWRGGAPCPPKSLPVDGTEDLPVLR